MLVFATAHNVPLCRTIGNVYTHATDDDAGAIWRDSAPTNGQPRPTSDKMSDKPNRVTRDLAAEMARHMSVSSDKIYEIAVCAFAAGTFYLDDVIPNVVRMSARDLLYIVRQIPTASEDDGRGFSIRVPSLDTADEHATLRRLPVQ